MKVAKLLPLLFSTMNFDSIEAHGQGWPVHHCAISGPMADIMNRSQNSFSQSLSVVSESWSTKPYRQTPLTPSLTKALPCHSHDVQLFSTWNMATMAEELIVNERTTNFE